MSNNQNNPDNDNNGNVLDTLVDLGPFGAPGFDLRERIDFSGHGKATNPTLPHENSEIVRADGQSDPLSSDLSNNQLPGMNFFFKTEDNRGP